MAFLTGWITNIILFILLAIVIDLLLPNSSMQKYTKIVIGLLLIAVILNPVFQLFSQDINQVIQNFQFKNTFHNGELKNSIELQKKEIQASERAYILEQMAVQMKALADKDLVKAYGTEIKNINLAVSNGIRKIQSQKDLQRIEVIVKQPAKDNAVAAIQRIDINTQQERKKRETADDRKIQEIIRFLAKKWQLDEKKITVHMEGGAFTDHG
ncbi:stage III sporulation protein AF [Metabacillus sp. RGM 3146]|uniref:stage III sporulation protein AF n=1 Tax=Metabacillus sp. RGM 3146 TaxID=3401092 RepID=UPI003B9A6138